MTKINQNAPTAVHHTHDTNHTHAVPSQRTTPQPGNSYLRGGQTPGVEANTRPTRTSLRRSVEQAPQASAASHPNLDNVRQGQSLLRRGASGPQVESLQQMLNRAGANPPLATDGQFGPLTQAAVREFQTKRGIQVDGVVGPQTMGALDRPNRTGQPHGHSHTAPTSRPNGTDNHSHAHGTSNADAYENGRNIGRIQVTNIDGKPVELRTAQAFERMRDAAARDGVNIRVVSGFRSNQEQAALYQRYLNGTGNLAARPGHSNHQNGRALDLNTSDASVLRWLNQNGSRFGFARTVPSEPWHWEHRH